MIRDRGKMKWQGMFIPQHVDALRGYDWDNTRIEKPTLDEQQLEEINDTICEAMEFSMAVEIAYYRSGVIEVLTGHIHYLDVHNKHVRIVTKNGEIARIKFSDITGVTISDKP
ncbi:YolD-like family protein [Fictibacillus terranigra]|uniref:YolD-like family protein n=1 Tax=Fictibacillus terranigra TaxID=3058424 RepID=A0ABT8E6U1_9BACL|nr:YolD-like family protein [Fictibacillus sp. CENA-BCM004]MDN4073621.1 YolD-like family protein [Fictibacillus sp. CENA-BCM004]